MPSNVEQDMCNPMCVCCSLDPLFFYIPIIDRDFKYLKLHNRLKDIALVLRSLTDLFSMVDLVLQIVLNLLISKVKISTKNVLLQEARKFFLQEGNQLRILWK